MNWEPWLLPLLLAVGAALYASVGHGGASAYLAILSLAGTTPESMRPVALVLNLIVSGLATWRFRQAGQFDGRLFWPLAGGGIPAALLGGLTRLPPKSYSLALGVILIYAAAQILWPRPSARPGLTPRPGPSTATLVALGAAIGLISGMVGVGGGIFLSPLLLIAGWAEMRPTAAISAPFILVNSFAGLVGQAFHGLHLSRELVWWMPAVLVGGAIGAELGSRRLSPQRLRGLLALVLLIAGGKLLRMAWH